MIENYRIKKYGNLLVNYVDVEGVIKRGTKKGTKNL